MKYFIITLALFAAAYAQSTSQIEFTETEPTEIISGEDQAWQWIGGDGISQIVFTLMQGCDMQSLTAVIQMGKVDATQHWFYYAAPNTLVNGWYWVQLRQSGSTPVYTQAYYTGGGQAKSTSSSCPSSTAGSPSTTSRAVSNTVTSSSFPTPTSSSRQITGGNLPSHPATFDTTSTSSSAVPTFAVNTGNLIPGAKLLTGACTSPLFAYATNGLYVYPFEYPIYGCAGGRAECCPFNEGSVTINSPNYGITREHILYIAECPGDYTTVSLPSQTGPGGVAVNLCCPSGWNYGTIYIDSYRACYSILSRPLASPTPMTISYMGDPTYVVQQVVTSTVFAMPLYASASGQPKKGLSKGAIAGIVIAVLGGIALAVAVIWFVLLRKHRQRNANRRAQDTIEESHPQPPEYTAEKIVTKPAITETTAPIADHTPVSPISSPSGSTRRKPVAANTDSMLLSDEERALVESVRAEQAKNLRRQRASELEEVARREEIQGAQIHEIDAGIVGPSELEGRR